MGIVDQIKKFNSKVKLAIDNLPHGEIVKALNLIEAAFERDGKIFVFGNGGSYAMATHWSSDFNKTVISKVKKLPNRIRSFQAIRIPITDAELTAWANDSGYENVFVEPLKNHIRASDLVIAISSSGNSPNVIRAVELAKSMAVPVIGLSGFDGGKLNELADAKVFVQTEKGEYGVVESVHGFILHLMTDYYIHYFESYLKWGGVS